MNATLKLLSLLCCFVALAGLPARAASCSISTGGVAFGSFNSLGPDRRDTIGTITVNCTGLIGEAVGYSLLLDTSGQHGSYRAMTNGVHKLDYLIFTDNSFTQLWGDGTAGSVFISDNYTMATSQTSRSYPMYGRIPTGQTRSASGTYIASLIITLSY